MATDVKNSVIADLPSNPEIERIPCHVFQHAKDASVYVASQIADAIRSRADEGKPCVLGLATGITPTTV